MNTATAAMTDGGNNTLVAAALAATM